MSEFIIIVFCAISTTIIACIFDYFYFSKLFKKLQQDFKHQTIIFENDIELCKKEILHTGCKLSQIEKNIIYVEKGV